MSTNNMNESTGFDKRRTSGLSSVNETEIESVRDVSASGRNVFSTIFSKGATSRLSETSSEMDEMKELQMRTGLVK